MYNTVIRRLSRYDYYADKISGRCLVIGVTVYLGLVANTKAGYLYSCYETYTDMRDRTGIDLCRLV